MKASGPVVVSYGVGLDSTALLVEMHNRGLRPDLILFSDTGAEKPETYAYLPIINAWLQRGWAVGQDDGKLYAFVGVR